MQQPLKSNFKFKVGDKISSIYCTGEITALPKPNDDARVYQVLLSDPDSRIDGKTVGVYESEIVLGGDEPRFVTEYKAYLNKPDSTDREPTYGEVMVGLSVDRKGIDAFDNVFRIKTLFANVLDEAQYQIKTMEKELFMASQQPNYNLSSSVASLALYKETVSKTIETKFLMVSAAIGNNDRP